MEYSQDWAPLANNIRNVSLPSTFADLAKGSALDCPKFLCVLCLLHDYAWDCSTAAGPRAQVYIPFDESREIGKV